MDLTAKQQEKVQVCKNNRIGKFAKSADKRRMEELGERVGVKERLKKKLVVGGNGLDMWKNVEMNNWQREQMPRRWRGKGCCCMRYWMSVN